MKILTGLLFLLAGIGYLYSPAIIMRINEFMKNRVFNDNIIIHHRRKIGIALVLIGFIVLFFGINR